MRRQREVTSEIACERASASAKQGRRARVMHVTGGRSVQSDRRAQARNGFHTPIRYLAAIDLYPHICYPIQPHLYTNTNTYAINAEMDYDNAKRLKSSSGSPISVKRSGATALPQYQPPPAR